MKREEKILLNLINNYAIKHGKAIPGKKALQKLVYFSQVEGLVMGFDYVLYKYGPYSYELDSLTKEMEYFEQIKFNCINTSYEVIVVDDVPSLKPEEINKLEAIIERYGVFSPKDLELLSTVHFIATDMAEIYRKKDVHEILNRVKSIKRNKFSWNEIKSAYNKLQEWGLVN
jgi:hypothetical protein